MLGWSAPIIDGVVVTKLNGVPAFSAVPAAGTQALLEERGSPFRRNGRHRNYSITSVASASIAGETVRLSAFAVLRLIAKSNLVETMHWHSAGFSPLRIRPV